MIKDLELSQILEETITLKLIEVFKSASLIDYDFIRKNCDLFTDQFWKSCMKILRITGKYEELFIQHKDVLMTNCIREYNDQHLPNYSFLKMLTTFCILTKQQIEELSYVHREENFNVVMRLVKTKITFQDYTLNIKPYIVHRGRLNDSLVKLLQSNAVYKWNSFFDKLKNTLMDEDQSLERVRAAL